MSSLPKKPLLFFNSFHGEGHTNPVLFVASAMIARGYEVAYLCTATFKDRIEAAGAEFIEMPEPLAPGPNDARPAFLSEPTGPRQLALQLSHVFYKNLPARSQRIVDVLQELRARDPQRQIIFVEDGPSMGILPFRHGRQLPTGFDQMPKTIGISPVPLMLQSQDTAPFMLGLVPDATESGRSRNRMLNKLVLEGPMSPLIETWREAMEKCHCTVPPEGSPMDAWFTPYDATFMLCSPSLEYPRSDLPPNIHFGGSLPRAAVKPGYQFPEWWGDVLQEGVPPPQRKKVVLVSQGTVRKNWSELLIPTIQTLGGREDLLVVAALGKRGDSLPVDLDVPANVKAIDYVPFDAILEYTDVFVSNGGYGAFGHAVKNGVPSVFAGESEDKLEVAMRAEWAGFAVNLKTQTPTQSQIREAVQKILDSTSYKTRAVELQRENEELDVLTQIERKIEEYTE